MKILNYPSSGSFAGQTFSRNRFGQYVRTRAIPVNPSTSFQVAVRARMSQNASDWRNLTALQRAGWGDLGNSISRTDSLGQTYTLTGYAAFCLVNNNKAAAGDAQVTDAPALALPDPIASLTPTVTSASLSIAFTVSPLGAGIRAFVYASPCRSAGRSFETDYRLIAVTAAAGTTPINALAGYQARFGNPITGMRMFLSVQTYLAGFMGPPLNSSVVVA